MLHQVIQLQILRYLEVKYADGCHIDSVNCPGFECQTYINVYMLQQYLGREKTAKLEKRKIEAQPNMFSCPACKEGFELPKKFRKIILTCPQCNKEICRLCNDSKHEGACKTRKEVTKRII